MAVLKKIVRRGPPLVRSWVRAARRQKSGKIDVICRGGVLLEWPHALLATWSRVVAEHQYIDAIILPDFEHTTVSAALEWSSSGFVRCGNRREMLAVMDVISCLVTKWGSLVVDACDGTADASGDGDEDAAVDICDEELPQDGADNGGEGGTNVAGGDNGWVAAARLRWLHQDDGDHNYAGCNREVRRTEAEEERTGQVNGDRPVPPREAAPSSSSDGTSIQAETTAPARVGIAERVKQTRPRKTYERGGATAASGAGTSRATVAVPAVSGARTHTAAPSAVAAAAAAAAVPHAAAPGTEAPNAAKSAAATPATPTTAEAVAEAVSSSAAVGNRVKRLSRVRCPFNCGTYAAHGDSFKMHLLNKHMGKIIMEKYGNRQRCSLCKQKIYEDDAVASAKRYKLYYHYGIHHGKLEVIFNEQRAAKVLQTRQKAAEKGSNNRKGKRANKDTLCFICDKSFGKPDGVRYHLARTHFRSRLQAVVGTRRHCRACDRRFTPGGLVDHFGVMHGGLLEVAKTAEEYRQMCRVGVRRSPTAKDV